jgi:hypothetical protein
LEAYHFGALAGGRGETRERDSRSQRGGLPDFARSTPATWSISMSVISRRRILASIGIDSVFNSYYVRYMNAEGQSQPGQPPAIIFPSPGITFKGGLKIRFGLS